MQKPRFPSFRVRHCGAGFCVESPQLYVWEADERSAIVTAAELLGCSGAVGAPDGEG